MSILGLASSRAAPPSSPFLWDSSTLERLYPPLTFPNNREHSTHTRLDQIYSKLESTITPQSINLPQTMLNIFNTMSSFLAWLKILIPWSLHSRAVLCDNAGAGNADTPKEALDHEVSEARTMLS